MPGGVLSSLAFPVTSWHWEGKLSWEDSFGSNARLPCRDQVLCGQAGGRTGKQEAAVAPAAPGDNAVGQGKKETLGQKQEGRGIREPSGNCVLSKGTSYIS